MICVAYGPASTRERSATSRPVSGPDARVHPERVLGRGLHGHRPLPSSDSCPPSGHRASCSGDARPSRPLRAGSARGRRRLGAARPGRRRSGLHRGARPRPRRDPRLRHHRCAGLAERPGRGRGPQPPDDAAHPPHARRARLRPGRRRPAPADPARAGARARVRLGQRRLVARPPAPRAAQHRDGRVLLDRRARRRRHRLRRPRRRAQARGAVGRHRDAVPGRRDLARQGPPRAPARRPARRRPRRADPVGDHPGAVGVPRRAARRARRRARARLGHHRPGARPRGAVDRRARARRRTGG